MKSEVKGELNFVFGVLAGHLIDMLGDHGQSDMVLEYGRMYWHHTTMLDFDTSQGN